MHLLIPFAFCSADGCAALTRTLALPNLSKLLARMVPQTRELGDAASFSPPHEVALARSLGLPETDGQIPWAALHAQSTRCGCAFVSPCHWEMGTHHIAMDATPVPDFPEQESRALLTTLQPFFAEDGVELVYDQPTRWLARGDVFEGLQSASLDRVMGQAVGDWMPRGAGLGTVQRLQAETQMLLYHHPVNTARSERGVALVNSFWISGSGTLDALPEPSVSALPPATVAAQLRQPALDANWSAWASAWESLDANECAALLAQVVQTGCGQLTLCGDNHWQTFDAHPSGLRQKFMSIFGTKPPSHMLEKL